MVFSHLTDMASGKPIQEIPDKHSAVSQFACQVFFYLDYFTALFLSLNHY